MIVSLASNIKHLWQTMLVDLVDAVAVRRQKQRSKTLLLVHLDAIGDYILVRNFIRVLRDSRRYSGYSITLCGNEQYKDLAEWLDVVSINDFIWINRRRFRFDISYRFSTVRKISERGFAVAVNPAASRIYYWSDSVIRASGSPERIGSVGDVINMKPWQKKKADHFYTRLIPATDPSLFEFIRNKSFFEEFIGEPIAVSGPFIETKKIPDSSVSARPYAVLFPGAGEPFRRWNPENFARVADYLSERFGLTVVIAGSSVDIELARRIRSSASQAKLLDMTGESSLPELVGIIAHADILISNETSAVHIAAAVGTRVVCISNGNQLGRFSPYPQEVFSKASYLYPPQIMEHYDRFAELCVSFARKSSLDINSVTADTVIEQIYFAISGSKSSQAKGGT